MNKWYLQLIPEPQVDDEEETMKHWNALVNTDRK